MTQHTALAVDLGSSAGRVVAGIYDGEKIELQEIHRFPHAVKEANGQLFWDLDFLFQETVTGLRQGIACCPNPCSVSVDTWGVDYVPLDIHGNIVGKARAYRDPRTERTAAQFTARLPNQQAWETTGTAPASINTANQLFAFHTEEPELAAKTKEILWLPDYFTYLLSKKKYWSPSICSTSGLTLPGAKNWAFEVFTQLGIPQHWVGELTPELSRAGKCQIPGLEMLEVVRAGAHDTACAVFSIPTSPATNQAKSQSQTWDTNQSTAADGTYFLSVGSWSLLGCTTAEALLSESARNSGLTNEVRTDGAIRLLYNMTGLWVIQEMQKQWQREGNEHDIVKLVQMASAVTNPGYLFDPSHSDFMEPGDMATRVQAFLTRTAGAPILNQAQLVRIAIESLAEQYRLGLKKIQDITKVPARHLHLVGGGSRNHLLCKLTAQAAGIPVIAGPAEASALGAILGQLQSLGIMKPNMATAVVNRSCKTQIYLPQEP